MTKRTHGHAYALEGRKTREYAAWNQMKMRCHNPRNPTFEYYGARGISVCARWRNSFAAFIADMGRAPPGHTLDRKHNDRNYTPSNCRWATRKEQCRNRRTSHMITYRGKTAALAYWAERYGLTQGCLLQRIAADWPVARALHTPARKRVQCKPCSTSGPTRKP